MVDSRPTFENTEGDLSAPSNLLSTLEHPTGQNEPATQYYRPEDSEMDGRGRKKEFEEYDEEDARAMSPRRSIAELEQIGREAKALLEEYV